MSTTPANLFVHPKESQSVILQVNNYLQRAYPSRPRDELLHAACVFEANAKRGAVSRADYVKYVTDGVRNILAMIQASSVPTSASLGVPSSAGPSTGPQMGVTVQRHDQTTVARATSNDANGAYLELLRDLETEKGASGNAIWVQNNPSTSLDANSSKQKTKVALKTAAVEKMPVANAARVSPAMNGEVSASCGDSAIPSMQATAALYGPTQTAAQLPVHSTAFVEKLASSNNESNSALLPENSPKNDQREENGTADLQNGHEVLSSSNRPKSKATTRPTTRFTRRTSRARNTRSQARNPSTNVSSQKPPTTRSRAKKVTKRTPKKRETRGRKRSDKEPANATASLENKETRPPDVQSLPCEPDYKQEDITTVEDVPDMTSVPHSQLGSQPANALYTYAQHQTNQKYNKDSHGFPHGLPNGFHNGSQPAVSHQIHSSSAGSRAIMGNISAQRIPVASTSAFNISSDIAPTTGVEDIRGSEQVTKSGPAQAQLNYTGRAGQPTHLVKNGVPQVLTNQGYLQPSPIGIVEIGEGIHVPEAEVLMSAASIGIILTADQIRLLTREQALRIMIKANELSLQNANSQRPTVSRTPAPAQPLLGEGRNPLSHEYTNVIGNSFPPGHTGPTETQDGPTRQPSKGTSVPFATDYNQCFSGKQPLRQADVSKRSLSSDMSTPPRTTPVWSVSANVPEVQARLRKFQVDYKMHLNLLTEYLSRLRDRDNSDYVQYLRCSIHFLTIDTTNVRGINVDIVDKIEKFMKDTLQRVAEIQRQVNIGAEGADMKMQLDNVQGPCNTVHLGESRRNPPQGDHRPADQKSVNPVRTQTSCAQKGPVNSIRPGLFHETGVESAGVPPEHSRSEISFEKQSTTHYDHHSLEKSEAPMQQQDDLTGKKRKTAPCAEIKSNGKRIAVQKEVCSQTMNAPAEKDGQRIHARYAKKRGSGADAPVHLIDLTEKTRPLSGVSVYCQRDKNGNVTNLLRLSDRPKVEDVVERLRFMLNCAMKLTTCYISVSQGKEEDKKRNLEEIVVSLEPRRLNLDEKYSEDVPETTGLTMMELVSAECAEARKRYGALTVQMSQEFGRPVFRGILRYNDSPFPRLELRVTGPRKSEAKIYKYERPPMGWVGVLEHVRKLFCSSLDGGEGVEAMIRSWIRSKEEFNDGREIREGADEQSINNE